MKAKLTLALPLALLLLGALGCGQQTKAAEEDQANIDRLVKEGIGTGPQGGMTQQQGAPASGAVEPP